jgi:hypothetical protein
VIKAIKVKRATREGMERMELVVVMELMVVMV